MRSARPMKGSMGYIGRGVARRRKERKKKLYIVVTTHGSEHVLSLVRAKSKKKARDKAPHGISSTATYYVLRVPRYRG